VDKLPGFSNKELSPLVEKLVPFVAFNIEFARNVLTLLKTEVDSVFPGRDKSD
jgi:hypothetical protein